MTKSHAILAIENFVYNFDNVALQLNDSKSLLQLCVSDEHGKKQQLQVTPGRCKALHLGATQLQGILIQARTIDNYLLLCQPLKIVV